MAGKRMKSGSLKKAAVKLVAKPDLKKAKAVAGAKKSAAGKRGHEPDYG